ncbi:Maf family protein [Anaeromyxobacter paludicola]|uniref:dTTP/UTP pyrophosphatase n=1 Tax=Anaeromyxobacter paludicola TaxID=2918171 RepID=A0ABM7X5N6_9BACT|nr:Maf family protein [Anaeromyxobacter paludicola]BDG07120.1 Maf-like protein [Anaeromyxobacter paludicola]
MPGILTLASASPRRRELLESLGLALEVRPAHADERQLPGEAARAYVARVAAEKARAVDGALVLAADTAVVVDGAVLGKPTSPEDARRMLRTLSGRDHEVLTGVCLRVRGGPERGLVVSSAVRFARLSVAQIDWYVATGEPLDKAGAYAVQGLGGAFVREVEGSVTNIVGLPVAETLALLAEVGHPLPWSGP